MYKLFVFSAVVSIGGLLMAAEAAPSEQTSSVVAAANIRVLVPDAKARVWFDGALTKQTGTDRLFHTPDLPPGEEFSYRIRAAWTQDGEEMIQETAARVMSGKTIVVDFTKPLEP